jgi:pimeloyl-ACP methyl ester carboxylesterase
MKKQLLILPGWDGTKQTWQAFIDIAHNDFDIYCLELPCFGSEPCPTEVWGVKEYADFIVKKIVELKLVKPILLGHSFGGQVAAYLAANNPKLLDSLILSGAAVFRQKNNAKIIFFASLSKLGKLLLFFAPQLAPNFKKTLYRLAGSPDYDNTSGIKREIFKKIIRQDIGTELPKIITPTLVVWGEKDSYVPLKDGKSIAQMIPGAKLRIIEAGKHGLHIKQPENLLQIIKEFLDN